MLPRRQRGVRLCRMSRRRTIILAVAVVALTVFAVEVYALSKFDGGAAAELRPSEQQQKIQDFHALVEARRQATADAAQQETNAHLPRMPQAPPSIEFGSLVVLDAAVAPATPLPKLELLMERIRAALHPFTKRYTSSRPYKRLLLPGSECGEFWSSARDGMYLPGCPSEGCLEFPTLDDAKQACSSMGKRCGGVTREDKVYQVREGSVPSISPNDDSSWIKVPDPCNEAERRDANAAAKARNVWEAFHLAMDAALNDESLNLQTPLGPAREDGSIFISIAAYRDVTCKDTLKRAFERAERPERISAGIVQQNCMRQTGCMTGTGWADTRRWVPAKGPDPDCAEEFCASALGKPHCEAGRVRILRLDEIDSLGPFFTRFINSKLYRGENFYLQIDAHTDFRSAWDTSLVTQMMATLTYPMSVISNYPPGGTPLSKDPWPALAHPSTPDDAWAPSALCSCSFETAGMGRFTVRLGQTGRRFKNDLDVPRKSCFVAAGFFIAHGSIVDDVGFDPFLPYLFMGEELALSARFYTSGYDIYAPSADVLRHEYVRKESSKFWETIGEVYSSPGLHNELSDLIVQRVQFLDAFPEANDATKLDPPSLSLRMDQFGLGKKRSVTEFNTRVGLDLVNKRQTVPSWCTNGDEGVKKKRGVGQASAKENLVDFDLFH